MFEYLWQDDTLEKLATIYVEANVQERDRMAAGIEAFNARLTTDPLGMGESRVGGFRVAFLPLLRVYYHVDVASQQVRVVDVSRYGR